jgi:hypothetical protein
MRTRLFLTAALVSSAAFGDTLYSGSSAATGTAFNPTGTFWNNVSSNTVNGTDTANVGNFLSDTGAFALNGNVTLGCPTCGVNYMAGGGQMFVNSGNTPDFVSNLNFVSQGGPLSIALLYANGFAEFGIYDASSALNAVNNHLILQPGQTTNLNNHIGQTYTSGTLMEGASNLGTYLLSSGSPFSTWGLYVTTCEEGSVSFAQCSADGEIVTFYMGEASQEGALYVPYDADHQHFALFQAGTNANTYYAGLEDFAFTRAFPTNPVEGYGDFSNLIFGIYSSSTGTATPEPATLSIVALGLAGLGFFGRHLKK